MQQYDIKIDDTVYLALNSQRQFIIALTEQIGVKSTKVLVRVSGRITIPKLFMKEAGLKAGDNMVVVQENEHLIAAKAYMDKSALYQEEKAEV
jgi:antitoxin component of MazEF toxin-antitoxin module